MPEPIRQSATGIDLSSRLLSYTTVDASPSAGSETVIATLVIPDFGDLAVVSGIRLRAFAAFTVGTSGVSANLKVRQTSVSGTTVCATGATTVSAGDLYSLFVAGTDATPAVGKYVLTLTVGSGAAASTVSALQLAADVI